MELLKELKELLEIPSVTGCAPETDARYGHLPYGKNVFDALKYMLDFCQKSGFRTKNCDNRIGWAEIGEGDELIGILVHLDVVPAGEGWDYPPFDLTVADGQMYGRGITDDKGPAILAVLAMKKLLESGRPLKKRIRIIFGCQEETGNWKDMEYYKEQEEIPHYGFTPDADFPAIYGEKGILSLEVSCPLAGSGIVGGKGGNAVNVVADYAELVLEDGETITKTGIPAHGSTPEEGENAIASVMEAASGKSKFAADYMKLIGYHLHGEGMGLDLCDEQSGSLTMNAGTLQIADDKLTLGIDIRYPVTIAYEEILRRAKEAFEKAGFSVTVMDHMDPVFMDKNGSLIQTLTETFREETGMTEEPKVIGGGTYARAMPGIVAFGPMIPGQPCTEHMKNERISVEAFETAARIYQKALQKLAGVTEA